VTQIRRLGITKLFLWSEAERFQTYPRALTRLTPDRTYTRRQIGEELFNLSYKADGKPRRESLLTNVFGLLQIAEDKLLLRGINLFRRITPNGWQVVSGMKVWERETDEWAPTAAALEMGEAYQREPAGIRWQQLLAEQLACYEPRTRVLLYLLSHGHALRFESSAYFAGNTQQTELIGENTYLLFGNRGAAFNALLFEHAGIAIGPWWREEVKQAGFELVEDFQIEGAVNRPPSTNYVNSALKTALYVFKVLGVLVEMDGVWRVDPDAFGRHLSPEITCELIGEQHVRPNLSDEWKQLAHIMQMLADPQGFVIAAQAAERWGELAGLAPEERPTAFDALLRRGIFEARVEVLDRHPGQPRMGRGLFGDDNMRMVKLRILS